MYRISLGISRNNFPVHLIGMPEWAFIYFEKNNYLNIAYKISRPK